MDLSKVWEIIQEAMEENLETVVLMLIVVASLYVTNILFLSLIHI